MKTSSVLIIEDNSDFRELLSMFMKENGCSVVTGKNAEEGLAQARICDVKVILLDIMLPDGSGVDVLKNVHKINPRVPVIMLTGNTDIEIATECMRNGAVDYITKPVDFEYLRTSVLSNLNEK